MTHEFKDDVYVIRQNVFNFLGKSIKVFNSKGEQVLFSRMKAFRLKEDIGVYTDESKTDEVFFIKARNIIDFSATYDIIDAASEDIIGSIRRKGFKSMFKDEWIVMDTQENELATLKEDNAALAFLRRFFSTLIPQTFHMYAGDSKVMTMHRAFNPFVNKVKVTFREEADQHFDHRLGLASALLIVAIENRG